MSLKIGIVGLPNVGKSTCFNALTKSQGAQAENYPFCTIDPNIGIVEVPDERLDKLAEVCNPEKTIPAAIEFVDIAGLVKGASEGEGLGNKFLANIRECHAIAKIVRFFEDDNITHVSGKVDPKDDLEVIITELVLADLSTIEKRIDRVKKPAMSGDKEMKKEYEIAQKIHEALSAGEVARSVDLTEDEKLIAKGFFLLTGKPIVYVANIDETQLADFDVEAGKQKLGILPDDVLVPISAKLEHELIDLSDDERNEYLQSLGVESSGLDKFIQAAYKALGLITYFTAGQKEVRAWQVPLGASAPQAAGVIHTDFEKGFIRAETIFWKDFVECGGEAGAKEKGLARTEGKDYIVKDGDVMHFRFNV